MLKDKVANEPKSKNDHLVPYITGVSLELSNGFKTLAKNNKEFEKRERRK